MIIIIIVQKVLKIISTVLLISMSGISYANSNISGEWEINKFDEQVFSLKIKNEDGKLFLSYVFIFMKGNKINDGSYENIILSKANNNCYTGEIFDLYKEESSDFSLCKKEDTLQWSTKNRLTFVPKSEVFIRSED